MKYKKTTLPNGLRIINIPMKGNPAATVLIMVEAGSNYESKGQSGLSHFLEHMCFKGTALRPNSAIIHRELDGLGAQSNAFTSTEYTGYYAKAEKQQWKKTLDILADMYLNPIFPKNDLEKERGVILQEISMYEDLPQSDVWEVLSKLMYGDTPAGRSIIGSKENVSKFDRGDFVTYRDAHYVAKKTIVVVAGDISESDIKREVSRIFKGIGEGKRASKPAVVEKQSAPALLTKKKKTDQMHIVIAMRSFDSKDKRSAALSILGAILGGGSSSRLSEKLRDEMGVCYYIRALNDRSTDHGVFSIASGIDPKRVDEVVRVVLAECRRMTEEKVSEEDLRRTKDYVAGNMYLSLETTDALAEFYAIQEVLKERLISPHEWEKELRNVTAQDIQDVAKEIFTNDRLNMAIVGDVRHEARLKKLLVI